MNQHDSAVRDVLLQRGTIYAAQGDDHATARLAGGMMREVMRQLPDLSNEQLFYCCKDAEKAARAITGGLGGVYHGDNGLDLSGYEALLASVSSGKPLYDVLPAE